MSEGRRIVTGQGITLAAGSAAICAFPLPQGAKVRGVRVEGYVTRVGGLASTGFQVAAFLGQRVPQTSAECVAMTPLTPVRPGAPGQGLFFPYRPAIVPGNSDQAVTGTIDPVTGVLTTVVVSAPTSAGVRCKLPLALEMGTDFPVLVVLLPAGSDDFVGGVMLDVEFPEW